MAIETTSARLTVIRRRCGALALAALVAAVSGCKLLPGATGSDSSTKPPAPAGVPCEAAAYWDSTVRLMPDPQREFQRGPCILGRVILLGKTQQPVCAEGTMIVKMYGEPQDHTGPPILLEQWKINKENLSKMVYKDGLGFWGYTLALPTETCTPYVARMQMEVIFHPENSHPLYAGVSTMRPNFSEVSRLTGQTVPANFRPGQPSMNGQPPMYGQPYQGMPAGQTPGFVPPPINVPSYEQFMEQKMSQQQRMPALQPQQGYPPQGMSPQMLQQQQMIQQQMLQQQLIQQQMIQQQMKQQQMMQQPHQPQQRFPGPMSPPLMPANYRPQPGATGPVVGQTAIPVTPHSSSPVPPPMPPEPTLPPALMNTPANPFMPMPSGPSASSNERPMGGARSIPKADEVEAPSLPTPQLMFQQSAQQK